MKKPIQTTTRLTALLLSLLMLLSVCTGCENFFLSPVETNTESTDTNSQETTATPQPDQYCKFELIAPPNVTLHTDLQKQYLKEPYNSATDYAMGDAELSRPEPVVLSWETEIVGYNTSNPMKYRLSVGKKSDLSDATVYTTASTAKKITNLEIGTTYYWRVSTTVEGETWTSETESFVTGSKGPRTMNVPGVANVRDIGGYKGLGGATIRQGLLYRCGRLNKNGSTTPEITSTGIDVMLNTMKVKTEIDLRENGKNGVTSSPLGKTVKYIHIPMEYEFDNPLLNDITGNLAQIKKVFHQLANESNYPMIFHCSIGTDRTGAVAFLLLAFLGVEEDVLYRDYLFSNFANIGGTRSPNTITKYLNLVKSCSGSTLAEKTYNYLKTQVGVPTSELDAIRSILLEK